MRRLICILFILTLNLAASAQNGYKMYIDTSNYYSYYTHEPGLITNWLRENEVVPVIMEEMERAGMEWLKEYALYKLNTGQYMVLSAYSRKSNVGIAYLTGHFAMVEAKNRNKSTDNFFHQRIDTEGGQAEFIKINNLPKNIYTLAENSYWYQYGNGQVNTDNMKLVTKDVAIRLLRMDVKRVIQEIKNTK
jgi:hypothetical protein